MLSDLKTLIELARPKVGASHKERIENFYQKQAGHYDSFRKKLLFGRQEVLCKAVEGLTEGAVWVDFGAGTGANIDALTDEQLAKFSKIYLLDLSPSLLAQARKKIEERQLSHIEVIETDVCELNLNVKADLVTFSYSLTMIPEWFKALNSATGVLKSGGKVAIVDFYMPKKYSESGAKSGSFMERTFWPAWFSWDDVRLNQDHVPYILSLFQQSYFEVSKSSLPFVPLAKVSYYKFIGEKP